MKIYRPIKTNYLGQGFGENKAMCKLHSDGEAIRPFIIKSIPRSGIPFGWASFYPMLGMLGHNGYDHNSYHGEPLYFPADFAGAGGWWSKDASDIDGGLGVDVISKKEVLIEGRVSYVKMRFWHLKTGFKLDNVQMGDLIGFCDNTGASSGDHLHWSLKRCTKDGRGIDLDNGYYGAIDFTPFYSNNFVLDVIGVQAQAMTAIDAAHKVIADVRRFLKSFML